jgi:hypothetical protein
MVDVEHATRDIASRLMNAPILQALITDLPSASVTTSFSLRRAS